MRSQDAAELVARSPIAFALLYVIASRAQRTPAFNRYNLKIGEAFIGDWRDCGMTRQQYRTAKKLLSKFGFASFKPTNKGTVATLMDMRVFDINLPDCQPASQPSSNHPATTTKKEKNEKNVRKGPSDRVPASRGHRVGWRRRPFPPTDAEVREFAEENELDCGHVERWLDDMRRTNWTTGDGRPVRDWRRVLLARCEKVEADRNGY